MSREHCQHFQGYRVVPLSGVGQLSDEEIMQLRARVLTMTRCCRCMHEMERPLDTHVGLCVSAAMSCTQARRVLRPGRRR